MEVFMKKTKMLAALTAMVLGLVFVSCPSPNNGVNPSPENPENQNPDSGNGSTTTTCWTRDSSGIKVNGESEPLQFTAEVNVIESAATVTRVGDNGAFKTGTGLTSPVTISPYAMGKYEVTQELYSKVMENQTVTVGGAVKTLSQNPSLCGTDAEQSDKYLLPIAAGTQKYRPVEYVTWFDAIYFCNALSEKLGIEKAYNITPTEFHAGHITEATVTLVQGSKGYRIPTEEEWEFAARGGDPSAAAWSYPYSGSTNINQVAWYQGNNDGTTNPSNPESATDLTNSEKNYSVCGTHPVGGKAPNAKEIYDMTGNVWEWCHGETSSGAKVDKGGCWAGSAANSTVTRDCTGMSGHERNALTGIRLVRSL